MSRSRYERWAMDTSDLIDECEELETANERLKARVAELTAERAELVEVIQLQRCPKDDETLDALAEAIRKA